MKWKQLYNTSKKVFKKLWLVCHIGLALLGAFVVVLFVLHELGLTNVPGSITRESKEKSYSLPKTEKEKYERYPWLLSKEWNVVRIGLIDDEAVIRRVSKETKIPPRILVGPIIGEQIRFFTTDRAQFESYFEPVKKLINLSQFSYGIAGIKPDTAKFVEQELSNTKSPYYLGKDIAQLIAYTDGENTEYARISRLNDESHYWSYLYVALIQKMLIQKWQKAGYDIAQKPGVIATLYNLGFGASKPHKDPQIGGVPIDIDGKTYSFGELAEDFYYSGELANYLEK